MHDVEFIQDLAVVLLLAGFITVLFHRFKQPVVLGYILCGIIIGPFTPPFALIQNEQTIRTMAELGVIMLMFSLGLEFSFRKLSKVGIAASITAIAEIFMMVWIGYEIGHFLNWDSIDSIFLGAILAISSSTIIVKALTELKLQKENFVQLIFGVLIIEDILAIAILALLSSFAISGKVNAGDVFITLSKLTLFIVVSLVFGWLIVPRLLAYVAKFKSNEMLLITVLGLCFGFCLLVIELNYSIALGAFVIGAIMAESRELKQIERMIEPVRDMFSAIFFVSVGLMFDPKVLSHYAIPILIITAGVIIGKILACTLGMLISGKDGRTSLRVGMGLAQIGEFSFIIAALGMSLDVTSHFLYPIAVAVSVITTFLTPYLIRSADHFSKDVAAIVPQPVANIFRMYADWIRSIRPSEDQQAIMSVIRVGLLQILVNLAIVISIFLAGPFLLDIVSEKFALSMLSLSIRKTVTWGSLLIVSLPFLIAIYRKTKGLSMLIAELSVRNRGSYNEPVRRIISEMIPICAIVIIMIIVMVLSTNILPPKELVYLVLVVTLFLVLFLWRWFIKLHAKLQVALLKTMKKDEQNTEG